MVEGPAIKPYTFDWGNNYHLIPYKSDDTSEPISLENLILENEEIALYFCDHRELLDKQSDKSKTMHRGDEFYALSKIGPYTFAPYIVAARDNSNFCSSVINPVLTPWGEVKHAICVKHTIIISQDVNENFITEEESHYINAILNSSIVHSYIHATFKTNGFSLKKSNLCIPKFDSSNRLHMRLVALSKYASLDVNESKRERVSDLSSTIYQQICREAETLHVLKHYDSVEEEPVRRAADPMCFEYYSWNRFDKKIINIFGDNNTILLGCYKNKKHLDWIVNNGIYNIRLGNRQGSVDEDKKCIGNANLLVLYDSSNFSRLSVYKILSHKILTGDDLRALCYPKKRIGKRYMTFEIVEVPFLVEDLKNNHLIENLIANYPDHVKGAPVFLEP